MLTTFPQCNFSLEFPEILNQSYNAYYGPGESWIYKIMHCGILISMPYEHCDMVILTAVPPSLRPHLPSLKQCLMGALFCPKFAQKLRHRPQCYLALLVSHDVLPHYIGIKQYFIVYMY